MQCFLLLRTPSSSTFGFPPSHSCRTPWIQPCSLPFTNMLLLDIKKSFLCEVSKRVCILFFCQQYLFVYHFTQRFCLPIKSVWWSASCQALMSPLFFWQPWPTTPQPFLKQISDSCCWNWSPGLEDEHPEPKGKIREVESFPYLITL